MSRRAVLFTILFGLFVSGCRAPQSSVPLFADGSGRLRVAVSFYPLQEFATGVGGDQVDLVTMVPGGVEPHDWEPTPGHIKTLGRAQVFLFNGRGMESWVEKTLNSLGNPGPVSLETSAGFDGIPGDPHVWLDPLGAMHQVNAIRDAFAKADPANTALYTANAAAYTQQLTALDEELRQGLAAGCTRKEFFTSHEAFAYLARRYGLTQRPIAGLSPEDEPKPKDLVRIVQEARQNQIRFIFFETLASDKVANVIATEIGAKTLVLNPFEGLTDEDVIAGKNYFTVMRENLANLKVALECGK